MSGPPSQDHPGGPLVIEKPVVRIDRAAFTLAVQTCLSAAGNASLGGAKLRTHPTPFRMATEVREALQRACGVEIEVEGWEDLLQQIKPAFPGAKDAAEG